MSKNAGIRQVKEIRGKTLPTSRRFGGQLPVGSYFLRKVLILGTVATLFSLFGMLGIVVFNSSSSGEEEAVNQKLTIIVPKVPVYRGMKLEPTFLKEISFPETELRGVQALTPVGNTEVFYAKVDLPAEQPIVLANLSKTAPVNEIPTKLPPGHRAVTIAVDATSGVEGWSQAGTHVDVFVSFHDPEDRQQKTQVAVEDALVLSFNGITELMRRDSEGNNDGALPHVPQAATVTLAVPIQDALTIKTAGMMGTLSLVVRNPEDLSRAQTNVVARNDILEKQPGFARAQLASKAPAPVVAPVVVAPPPVIKKPIEKPKGFIRFPNLKTGKNVEMQLFRDGWEYNEKSE